MRCAMLFVIFAALCCPIGFTQDSVTIASDPRDPSRPVSTLLSQLRQREKISVTYEDPRYSNSADVDDVTSQVAKNLSHRREVRASHSRSPRQSDQLRLCSPRPSYTRTGSRQRSRGCCGSMKRWAVLGLLLPETASAFTLFPLKSSTLAANRPGKAQFWILS